MARFTHTDENGRARMVDVGAKPVTDRSAAASGSITMNETCFAALRDQTVKKGDVLAAARIAGIMAAKQTSSIIPLCHPLFLTGIAIDFELDEKRCAVHARCETSCQERTGVEMEALTGVSAALLTVYDMCKALDRSMVISDIRVERKDGGASGTYERNPLDGGA